MSPKPVDEVEISLLTSQHSFDAFELLCEGFNHGSVLHKAAGISLNEYRDYMRAPFDSMWQQGLSVGTTDTVSGEIVGCLVAGDFALQTPGSTDMPDSMKPV